MPPLAHPLRRSLLLAMAGAGLQACGHAQPAAAPARGRPAGPTVADRGSPHYGFARFGLGSADGQRRYRVQLAVPNAAPPAAGHPLLVLLDGNAAFAALTDAMLADAAAGERPPAIAALGYETDLEVDMAARSYDYTPPVPDAQADAVARRAAPVGGADLFLDLLQTAVLPEIGRRVRCDPTRSTLWGHSYGGLLTLYTLFTRPGLFTRYAAADPSLWWHERYILAVEARAQALPAGRSTALLLMTGGSGTPAPGAGQAPERERRRSAVQDAAPGLAQRQAQRAGLAVRWTPFPGVGHGAMRPASLPPTLAFAAQ